MADDKATFQCRKTIIAPKAALSAKTPFTKCLVIKRCALGLQRYS